MKQLVCEMCGSGDIVKQDGFFVCQACGCKYSLEEAKKLIIEGTVHVSGTVRVDHSGSADNYLKLLENALSAGNNQQAELYCNKIIEVDPTNWYAWLKKGHAAGWQSTLANMRISEAITYFGTALGCTEDEKVRAKILEYSQEDLQQLCLACVRLQSERFAKWPDEDEMNGVLQVMTVVIQALKRFVETMRIDVNPDTLMTPIAKEITDCVVAAWDNVVVRDYVNDDDTGHPGKFAFSKMIERAGHCILLLKQVVTFSESDEEHDIRCYNLLINMNNYCSDAAAWDYKYETDYILGVAYRTKNWYVATELTDSAVAFRNDENRGFKAKIDEIQRAIDSRKAAEEAERRRIEQNAKEARVDAYWQQNPEQKAELEKRKEEMIALLHGYETDLAGIDRGRKVEAMIAKRDRLQEAYNTMSAVRFFKRMELQKEIDGIDDRLERRRIKFGSAIQAKINVVKEELAAIEEQLTRDRT